MGTKSWVIVNKETNKAVMETYNKDTVSKINTAKYRAIPALEYLQSLNKGE